MKTIAKSEWHVAYTYPNAEKKIMSLLLQQNFNVYLPLQEVVRKWSRGLKKLDIPLFPNYLFVNITPKERGYVLSTPGVVRFLTLDGTPSLIKEKEIDSIKAVLLSKYEVVIESNYEVGDEVEVSTGSLQGMRGVLTEKKGEKRFLVRLKTLNKILSVNISGACLSKLSHTPEALV